MTKKEPTYEPIRTPSFTLIADLPTEKGHLLTFFVPDSEKRKELLAICLRDIRARND